MGDEMPFPMGLSWPQNFNPILALVFGGVQGAVGVLNHLVSVGIGVD